ncbi:MAG TPA: alkene reductase [Pseudonocardiaceae bacterium]|nr:alkene reductase [Pseudonocardiaceae bacterium]
MNYEALWSPTKLGNLTIEHRLAMSPMTRNRSTSEGVPGAMNARYYAQRASNALIITEGTQPSPVGQGYMLTPGIYTAEQVAGWRKTTDAVHAAGGRILIQLMHVGRIAHPANTSTGAQPVAPSPVRPATPMYTASGEQEIPVPRELSEAEIAEVVREHAFAAAAAIRAGADGVEVHGANGYLVHQFLAPNTNLRHDRYGGSVQNRVRFAVEVVTAIAAEIGPERTGIRISPGNPYNDIEEPDPREVYVELVRQLAELRIAHLHVVHTGDEDLVRELRDAWPSTLILNRPEAGLSRRVKDIEDGLADIITVGALSLANPDLVERLRTGAELNEPDPETFYGGTHVGYTDYPTLADNRR